MGANTPAAEWRRRTPRWAGIRSARVDVRGISVHVLRQAAAPTAGPEARTHVLLHGLGNGAWTWLDVIPELAERGPVVAIDLPGSGWTRPDDLGAARIEPSAEVVRDVLDVLELEHVVLHGHSLGGLVAAVVAARWPSQVKGLVLANAPLPGNPEAGVDTTVWRTIGRFMLWLLPFAGPIVLRVLARRNAAVWRRLRDDPDDPAVGGAFTSIGGDPRRISPELREVIVEQVQRYRIGWRAAGAVTSAASVLSALTVEQARFRGFVDAVRRPTLFVGGTEDRLVPVVLVDELRARYPGWSFEILEGYGHLLPWEAPVRYVEAVDRWMEA